MSTQTSQRTGSSGETIEIRLTDSTTGLPVKIASVASLNDQQLLTLMGVPAGGNYTLEYDGQTTATIAVSASLPARYLMWQFAVTAGHAQTLSIALPKTGGCYSINRADIFDGISGSTPGPLLAGDCLFDASQNPPASDHNVSLDGFTTSYMKTLATVTPASSLIVMIITANAGGTGGNALISVATCLDTVTSTLQKIGNLDAGYSHVGIPNYEYNPATTSDSGGYYNNNYVSIYSDNFSGPPFSTGGLAVTMSAADVQTKLQALSNVGAGNMLVTDTSGVSIGPFTVDSVGSLAQTYQNPLVSSSGQVVVAHPRPGGNAPTYTPNGGSAIKLYDFLWGDGVHSLGNPVVGNTRCSGLWQLPQRTGNKTYLVRGGVYGLTGPWSNPNDGGLSKQYITVSSAGATYTTYCEQFQCANGTAPITCNVYMTWVPDNTLSNSVPVLIEASQLPVMNGSSSRTTLHSGTIDQSVTPSDLFDQGVWWKLIASVTIQYPDIDIVVTITNATGTISFDAVQVRPTSTDISQIIAPSDSVRLSIPDGYLSDPSGPLTGLTNLVVTNAVGVSRFAMPTTANMTIGLNIPADNANFGVAPVYSSIDKRIDFTNVSGCTLGTLNYPVSATSESLFAYLADPGSVVFQHFSNINAPVLKPGMYVLEWQGTSNIEQTYNFHNYTFTEQVEYQIINPSGNRRVYLLTINSDQTYSPQVVLQWHASGPAVGGVYPFDVVPGSVRYWQPDPSDPTGMTPWLTNRKLFYPPTIACLRGASYLRFLDWTGANSNSTINFSDYALPNRANGPSRTISVPIVSISPCTSGQFFCPSLFVSVIVQTSTAHGLTDFCPITLNTTAPMVFSSGTLGAGSITCEQIKVIDATHFQVWMSMVSAPDNLTATITGGTATLQTGMYQGPYIDQFLLANEIGCGIHLNLSLQGTADCHYQEGVCAGTYFRNGGTICLENGNEPWNPQFGGTYGLLNLSWNLAGRGTFRYDDATGMVQIAAAAYAQFMAGLASTGWSGTVKWGYGSTYGGSSYTTSICAAVTANSYRIDAVYIAPYIANTSAFGVEVNFNRLFDTMTANQARDLLCQYTQDGGWDTFIAANRAAMNTAGFSTVPLMGYEGMWNSVTPGLSQVAAFERSYPTLLHPETYSIFGGAFMPFCEREGMTNINLYTSMGVGFNQLGPLETSYPFVWPIWLYGYQANGTGNWTTDSVNITNVGAYNQIKSEIGGAVKYYQALVAGSGGGGGGGGSGGSLLIDPLGSSLMPLTFNSVSFDTVLSGLATPGLIPAGKSQICQRVNNSSFNLTSVMIAVTAPGGFTFDPTQIYVAVCADDGTSTEDPRPLGSSVESIAGSQTSPGLGSAYQPLGDVGQVVGVIRKQLNVLAQDKAGFRLNILNRTNLPLTVTASYEQG